MSSCWVFLRKVYGDKQTMKTALDISYLTSCPEYPYELPISGHATYDCSQNSMVAKIDGTQEVTYVYVCDGRDTIKSLSSMLLVHGTSAIMLLLRLSLKVLNFWKLTSYCNLKPLWSGMGEVVPARTSPTLHPPSPPTVHQLLPLAL